MADLTPRRDGGSHSSSSATPLPASSGADPSDGESSPPAGATPRPPSSGAAPSDRESGAPAGEGDVPTLLVDTLGTLCPVPIIEIAKAIKPLPDGALVRLLADDPGAERDLVDWSRATRHAIVGLERGPGHRIEALVRRRPRG